MRERPAPVAQAAPGRADSEAMAITSLSYTPSLRRLPVPIKLDYDLLEAASTSADDGQIGAAIGAVFAHLFPGSTIGDLREAPFVFVQGSSKVNARIEGDELVVTVPLVELTAESNAVAALRYVLTAISGSGQIYQPRLRGDALYMEFRDKLTRMHPAKVLEVLRRMPIEADRCDDWLVGQFGVRALDRAEIEPLTDDEAAKAEAAWRQHWDEIDELLKESQRKRSTWFLNEVTALALFRVQFVLPLCGYLLGRLSESAGTWNDGQADASKREAALARCVKEMKAVSAAELRANLGHARYALQPLNDGQPSTITGYFGTGDYIEAIDKYRTQGKPFEAALALYASTTYLLARFAWSPEVSTALAEGLAVAAGKPWRDAANALWDHVKSLVEQFGDDDDDDDDDDDEDEESGGDATVDDTETEEG